MTNKEKFKKLQPVWDAIEKLGWKILTNPEDLDDDHDEVEIENRSPAGEDLILIFYLNHWEGKNLAAQAYDIYMDFDVDENVKMWLEARDNNVSGVPSARVLVHDAEDIERMYEELSDVIAKVYRKLPVI